MQNDKISLYRFSNPTYSVYVSGVELCGLFEEEEARMGVYNVLDQGH